MDSKGIQFKTKGKWKEVDFVGNELNTFDDEQLGGLISMQELTDYEIVGSKSPAKKKPKAKKETEKKNVKKPEQSADAVEKKKKKRKPKKKNLKDTVPEVETQKPESSDPDISPTKRKAESNPDEPKSKKRKRNKKKQDAKTVECTNEAEVAKPAKVKEVTENDMPGWKDMFVPSPVLRALRDLGFTAPTPIQALALPSAIRDRKDIVGAAETGSGKTLAFGIPLIHHILQKKAERTSQKTKNIPHVDMDQLSDLDIEEVVSNDSADVGSLGSTDTSDNEEFPPKIDDAMDQKEDENDEEDVDNEAEDSDEESMEIHQDETDDLTGPARPLYALILTPTRELAIQIENHIRQVAVHTDLRIVTLVGGISLDKQRRLLKRCPEIVVATPGRLWELMEEGQPHLIQVPRVPYFVIDECDRMVQKGHFQELCSILELMNNDENVNTKRQTFVFSATLTFVHDAPNRFKKKKKLKKLTPDDKVGNLMSQIGIKEKPKVIDLTKKTGTAETLTETKIHCSVADKDVYLYYFLQQYPGRTLIFTNSKDCLRRLLSILTLLECRPLPLHADMHQKQRLKNLERFTASPNGLLLATDVAARGLDIPNVQHVIHFQVPQTTENYIHRSGRTARAAKEGLSFMIIGPDDIKNYRKILRSLKRTEDIPQLPVELRYLGTIKERLALAKAIDQQEHKKAKAQHHNNWFIKAARDMDIELEEDLLKDTGDSREKSLDKSRIQQLRAELKTLLRTPVISQNASHKYPTMSGRLVIPYMQSEQALDHVKSTKPLRLNPNAIKPKPKIPKNKLQKKKKMKQKS